MKIFSRFRSLTVAKNESIFSASLVLAITFGISAVLGFLRSRILYSRFFSCCVYELDAYNAAFRLPDLIFKLLVTGALSASFIPVFTGYLHKDKALSDKIGSTVINFLFLLLTLFGLIALIFTRPLSQLIAHGFSPYQLDLMVGLTRILLVAQLFFLISNFLTGILQAHQIFLMPALSPIIYNLFIILSIFTLSPIFGLYGVAYGAVVGAFFHFAIQIPVIRRVGFHYSPILDFKNHGFREVIRLAVPRALSLGLGEIENTITTFFTSTLSAGSLSLFTLALQLMYLPSRIFSTTIGQASLPILSKNIAKNQLDQFRETVQKTIFQSLYIAMPITTLILIHRLPLVRIAFGARQFPWSATILTAKILAFLTPAIICQAVIQILIRSFYALHNTKTPLYVSLASLTTNIVLNYFFISFTDFGVYGLAISSSLSNLVQFSGLLLLFIHIVDGFNWSRLSLKFFYIFISSISLGLTTWLSTKVLDLFILNTSRTISLLLLFFVTSSIGIITYIFVSQKLGLEQYQDYRRYLVKIKNFLSTFG